MKYSAREEGRPPPPPLSYRCLSNMGAQVAKQNAKNLRNATGDEGRPPPTCNCQRNAKNQCPIPGACNQKGVIYQATVTSGRGGHEENYVGLAADFKRRFYKHKASLEVKNQGGQPLYPRIFGRKKKMEGTLMSVGKFSRRIFQHSTQ